MDGGFITTSSVTILLVLFAFYLINVITKQESKPDYIYQSCIFTKEKDEKKKEEIEENRKIREQYNFNRNIGLLIMGIVYMLIYFAMENQINTSFGIAGIITILYGTIMNWTRYNDKIKLAITATGLMAVFGVINKKKFI